MEEPSPGLISTEMLLMLDKRLSLRTLIVAFLVEIILEFRLKHQSSDNDSKDMELRGCWIIVDSRLGNAGRSLRQSSVGSTVRPG